MHDEAYEYFTYDGAPHFSPASIAGSTPHTISLFSLSKTYGMAGWRIGYMVIPGDLFEAVNKIQDTNLICPPIVSQAVARAALEAGPATAATASRDLAAVQAAGAGRVRRDRATSARCRARTARSTACCACTRRWIRWRSWNG